jgi:hypothetical protein
MKRHLRVALATVTMGAILAFLALVLGFTPDGLQYGKWPAMDDRPTNWADTALHP